MHAIDTELLLTCRRARVKSLFAFRGQGTRALRHKYFGPTATGKMHVLTENGNREITVVGHYQHLGGLVHHSGETRAEVRRRIAQGHTTFTQHRKALFQNPGIPFEKRGELFQTSLPARLCTAQSLGR